MTEEIKEIEEQQPDGEPAVRVIAMPADTNMYGDIFGGWLMSHMDNAAGSVAARYAQGRAVTIAVDGMAFIRPVHVGDEVSVYAKLIHVGRTSMKLNVEAWRRTRHEDRSYRVTKAVFTFVAVGDDRRPRQLPPLEVPAA